MVLIDFIRIAMLIGGLYAIGYAISAVFITMGRESVRDQIERLYEKDYENGN